MLNQVMSNHETGLCGGPSCFALGILVLEAGHLVFHTNVHLHQVKTISKDVQPSTFRLIGHLPICSKCTSLAWSDVMIPSGSVDPGCRVFQVSNLSKSECLQKGLLERVQNIKMTWPFFSAEHQHQHVNDLVTSVSFCCLQCNCIAIVTATFLSGFHALSWTNGSKSRQWMPVDL